MESHAGGYGCYIRSDNCTLLTSATLLTFLPALTGGGKIYRKKQLK